MAKVTSGISSELEKAVAEMLEECRKRNTKGDGFVMSLEDRLLVVDRAIKLEMLKNKLKDADAGSAWDKIAGEGDGSE